MNFVQLLPGLISPIILCICMLTISSQGLAVPDRLRRSIFKIRVTATRPDFRQPWRLKPQRHSSGSGFYIGKGRILTNAHVVSHAHFITAQRYGDGEAVPVEVEFIAHDCDLAVLRVNSPGVWGQLKPITFGPTPKLHTPVAVLGFPTGGEQLSITEGVASRLDYRRYVHSYSASHLLLQVDSAINPGNSGGPVFQGDKAIGVAFQTHSAAENTGYVIPTPVVERFLRDISDGHYDGHPEDGVTMQPWATSNSAMASFQGLSLREGGAKIAHVALWSPAFGRLRRGDTVVTIDHHKIGVDGKIVMFGERIDFKAYFDLKDIGKSSQWQIRRGSLKKTVTVEAVINRGHHLSSFIYPRLPRYQTVGGFVFSVLTRNYVTTWGASWYRKVPTILQYLLTNSRFDRDYARSREFLVLTDRLSHPINYGQDWTRHTVLKKLNGVTIRSFKHFRQILAHKSSGFHRFDFIGDYPPIILDVERVGSADSEIAAKYGVKPYSWTEQTDGVVSRRRL